MAIQVSLTRTSASRWAPVARQAVAVSVSGHEPSAVVQGYASQVRDTHVNGGYLFGRWRAAWYSDVTAWFAARNRLDENEMHRLLFDSSVVRRDLSALQIPARLNRVPGALKEVPGGTLTLDGILATKIVRGGAYKSFQGSAGEAKRLANEAVADLTGRRYEDFRLHRTHGP